MSDQRLIDLRVALDGTPRAQQCVQIVGQPAPSTGNPTAFGAVSRLHLSTCSRGTPTAHSTKIPICFQFGYNKGAVVEWRHR